MKKFIRYIKAHLFCLKYPFMKPRNVWTGKTVKRYTFTCYQNIEKGWRLAFGKQLLKDYKKAYKKLPRRDRKRFYFTQIKEKYGELRLYSTFELGEKYNLSTKYSLLSMCYSMFNGEPVRYVTSGWIEYYSENDIKTLKPSRQCYRRLTEEDIPEVVNYKDGKEIRVDIKEKYGIDFYKAWDLKESENKKENNGREKL